ncbi:MAG: glucose-1-phosphate cytidylyltransferase [bacterium]
MKVVILCGGKGTRLNEETEFRPKPLVKIGDMPILWHIMKIYSYYGFNDFILCLGYRGEMIKEFFVNFSWMGQDFILELSSSKKTLLPSNSLPNWKITFVDTGQETNTGGRIKKIEKYIGEDTFMATYGDGVSNINIKSLLEFHKEKGRIATLTAIHPPSQFGIIEEKDGIAASFKEKPMLDGLINGGFFVFNKKIFSYLSFDSILEEEPLRELAKEKELSVYVHSGFWMCMDTFKQAQTLNNIWKEGKGLWKVW